MAKKIENTDLLEEELKNFIEKLNSENEVLLKILTGVVKIQAPSKKNTYPLKKKADQAAN